MIAEAAKLGANAVVATRFTTSMMMGGAAELLAVGTAAKFRRGRSPIRRRNYADFTPACAQHKDTP